MFLQTRAFLLPDPKGMGLLSHALLAIWVTAFSWVWEVGCQGLEMSICHYLDA